MKIKNICIAVFTGALLSTSVMTFANPATMKAMSVVTQGNQATQLHLLGGASNGVVISSEMCSYNICGGTLIKAADTRIGDSASWKIGSDLSHYCNLYWQVNANKQIAFIPQKSNCAGGWAILSSNIQHFGNGVASDQISINNS